MMSSMLYGEDNKTSLLEILKYSIKYKILLNIIVILVALFLAPVITGVFLKTANDQVVQMAIMGIRLIGIGMLPTGIAGGFRNFYQGINRLGLTRLLRVLSTYVFVVLPALILGLLFGTNGVWMAFIVVDILVLIFICIYSCIKNHSLSLKLSQAACFESGFGIQDEDLFESSMKSKDEVMDVSLQVSEFCKQKGADIRTRMMVSLAIEEMGMVIFQHNDINGGVIGKNHYEARVCQKNGGWIIRMRDDFPGFNPKEYVELYNEKDETETLGLRMIMGLSKEVTYVYALNLNNLIIRI